MVTKTAANIKLTICYQHVPLLQYKLNKN